MRKVEVCVQCGEPREIAARGLCFACYRREQRVIERDTPTFPDRHNPGIRREQKKLIRGFAAIMGGLSDLGVTRADVLAIRERLMPYLESVADYLGFQDTEGARVNGETVRSEFTVHSASTHTEGKLPR